MIEVNGILRAPAYIGNVYYNGGEKIKLKVVVTEKKSLAPEVVELSEESLELVEKTIKSLSAKKEPKAPAAPKAAAAQKAPEKSLV